MGRGLGEAGIWFCGGDELVVTESSGFLFGLSALHAGVAFGAEGTKGAVCDRVDFIPSSCIGGFGLGHLTERLWFCGDIDVRA